jgi:hypothetical protein
VIALAYLAAVLVALVVLLVAVRPRPVPPPTAPVPPAESTAALPTGAAEIRVILAAAHQLAARLDTAA